MASGSRSSSLAFGDCCESAESMPAAIKQHTCRYGVKQFGFLAYACTRAQSFSQGLPVANEIAGRSRALLLLGALDLGRLGWPSLASKISETLEVY